MKTENEIREMLKQELERHNKHHYLCTCEDCYLTRGFINGLLWVLEEKR